MVPRHSFSDRLLTYLKAQAMRPFGDAPSLIDSWRIFLSHVNPRRLLQEDDGVKGPLWFCSDPSHPFHVIANIVRLFFGLYFAKYYIFIPHRLRTLEADVFETLKRVFWSTELSRTPDALLLETPRSLGARQGGVAVASEGRYAVTGNRPKWLLKVEFRGDNVLQQTQVRYEWERGGGNFDLSLRQQIEESGYTAISYAMSSAKHLFSELPESKRPRPENQPKRDKSDRQSKSRALLNEYARARKTISGNGDGIEFIWLDEFCLTDENAYDKKEKKTELGMLADIFRGASRVVVFCHIEGCNHTGVSCPWANRLFTMAEILYTPLVLRMTRRRVSPGQERLSSFITIVSGSRFRSDMQASAERAKQWHLYNIMQHATNSGAVTWQSAIHSLVVEAIRRDEVSNFHDHEYLGKALNGLLPRRSQLEDLPGVNGWADLAWLLELNQGYYNAALLAAVCSFVGNDAKQYPWWGKPISPKEGTERLEALVHAVPVTLHDTPLLSIIGPKSIRISHKLQRDSAGLYRNPEMRSLMISSWAVFAVFFIIYIRLQLNYNFVAAERLWTFTCRAYIAFELLVGTIFVEKDTWFVMEDKKTHSWLRSQDPRFDKIFEWGARQLIPEWDRDAHAVPSPPGDGIIHPDTTAADSRPSAAVPYAVTLIDLRSAVFTKAVVTRLPNNMVALAVHGSGITCMLLDRIEKKVSGAKTAVKVGMASLPPYMLAQGEKSGTVYLGCDEEEPVPGRKM